MENLNHKLTCNDCGTIYLEIPQNVANHTPICCSTCGQLLGRWDELSQDFNRQGGQDGVFKLNDGQITRID